MQQRKYADPYDLSYNDIKTTFVSDKDVLAKVNGHGECSITLPAGTVLGVPAKPAAFQYMVDGKNAREFIIIGGPNDGVKVLIIETTIANDIFENDRKEYSNIAEMSNERATMIMEAEKKRIEGELNEEGFEKHFRLGDSPEDIRLVVAIAAQRVSNPIVEKKAR